MASFLFNGLATEVGEDRLRQMALIWMAEMDARNRLKDEFFAAGRAAADRLQELLRAGPLFPPGFRFREDEELEQEEHASVISPFAAADDRERATPSCSAIPPPSQHPEEADSPGGSLDGWPEIEIDLEAGDGTPLSPASIEPCPLFQPMEDQEGLNQLLELLGIRQQAAEEVAEEPHALPAAPSRLLQTHVLKIGPNYLEIGPALRSGVLRSQKPSIYWGPHSKNFPTAPIPAAILHTIYDNGPQSVKALQKMLLDGRIAVDQREAQQVIKQMTLQGVLVLA